MTWRDQAACVGYDFVFEEADAVYVTRAKKEAVAFARQLCNRCPVRDACLDACLEEEGATGHNSRYSVRGGLTPEERARMKHRGTGQAPGPTPKPIPHGTPQGAAMHRHRSEHPCDPCHEAEKDARAARRARAKSEASRSVTGGTLKGTRAS